MSKYPFLGNQYVFFFWAPKRRGCILLMDTSPSVILGPVQQGSSCPWQSGQYATPCSQASGISTNPVFLSVERFAPVSELAP